MSQKDSMDNAVEAGVKRNKTQKERSNDMRQEKKVGGTKRALLTSVLALVLSLAMLAGSTFAWFTDTASTGVNRIVSGNLDVGLEYWGGAESGWLTAENSEDLFDKNALWEPGYTQIVYLKVENNGNLALTYAMQITPVHETVGVNVDGEEFKLSDYIKFGWTTFTVNGDGTPVALDREAAQTGVGEGAQLGTTLHRKAAAPMAADAKELVALVAWMPENVGNEANYSTVQPTIELSLKVLATQATVESDSFDKTYDEDAATNEDLNNKPEYDYESRYDYDNSKGYGVELVRNAEGKVVKAIVSGVNGKVPDGFFANLKGSVDENGKPIAVPAERWADLTEVVIKDGVTEIGKDVFQGCVGLTKVTIPDSVKKIGTWSFYLCGGLKNVDIPANTEIGDSSFRQSGLEQVTVSGGSVGNYAFHRIDDLKKISINCETIGEEAFSGCDYLTDITLGENVKTLGDKAFYTCDALERVEIPSTVTDIGEKTFYSCPALKEAIIRAGTVKAGTFYNCRALTTLIISDNAMLDASFTAANAYAKETLETVKIGKGEICNSAFSNCTNLTTVELGNGVTSVGDNAFSKCTALTSVNIGDGVTSIGKNAFNGCTALTNANIGSGAIGESAFNGCTSLANVTLGNGVTQIGKNAFLRCTALTSISIGSGVTSIESGAFNGCTALTNANIGSGTIGASAFQDCSRLANVTLGDGVTSIGANAFLRCTELTSMNIGSSVRTIENYAFSGCTALEEVTISAAQIGNQAFRSAKALKKVTLGDDVVTIPAGAFSNCGMGNKNNSPELYLKAGTWTSNGQKTFVAEGASITTNDDVFNQIKSGKPATWSAPANP
jgi:predicted ribosomally synthesized peptide with SipW-like signal peptide